MANHEEHENCRQWLGTLSDFVDGELSEALCAEIERHMTGCENCRVVVDTLRKTVSLYHTSSAEPAECPEDVKERLFKRLDLDEFVGK